MYNNQKNNSNYIYIDGEPVEFLITLINNGVSTIIPTDNFVSLSVEENINSPFYKGLLTIKNDNNSFDTGYFFGEGKVSEINFDFVETGENLILIQINRKDLEKIYIFFVTDEYNETVNNVNCKNFVIEDSSFYTLRNRKIPFSTCDILETDTTQLSDADREVNISKAIDYLLTNNLTKNSTDKESWEQSANKIYFTSNCNDSLLTSLDYLMDKAIDKNNDPLYMFKRENKFYLYSLKKLYNDYLINNYNYNYGGTYSISSDVTAKPGVKSSNSILISSYNLYNESSEDTLRDIVNHKVVNYSFKNKKFNLYNKDNTVRELKDNINKNFLNKNTQISRETNERIENNTYFKYLYTTNPSNLASRYEGRNILLKNLINLSTMLSFSCPGVFNINTGNFVNINYIDETSNKNLKKLNGGWFVVGYKHTFTTTSFTSEIACTKFHELI